MLKAVVFDMDGLMIDSQPYWQQAQLDIFQQLGVPITRQDTMNTTGMRVDHIVQQCYEQSPWESMTPDEVCCRIIDRVTEFVQRDKPAMPGLEQAIEVCQQQGLRLAIASSSPMSLIDAAIDALKLHDVFEVKASGEKLRYGKPHPEVYLNACEELDLPPQCCVAIEDSFVGLLAAKAASMKAIVIPDESARADKRFIIADRQVPSLREIVPDLLRSL